VDWSGIYAGLNGGYGWASLGTEFGRSINADGWLGGGHIGIQRQFDRWVFGIEASYAFGSLDGDRTFDVSGNPLKLDAEISNLLLVTGRLGYAWSDRLAYVKGGYASADVEVQSTYLGTTTDAKSRLDGWTIGFGLERAITSRISIGIEYNYIDLESITVATPSAPPIVAAAAKVAPAALVVVPPKPSRIDPDDIHTVFARVTFRFGGEEPRHTPYK
jgi:outer membrane immunogenic protein